MTKLLRRSFLFLVLACGIVAAETPKPGAATVDDLLKKFDEGVDAGDVAAVRSCFDTSKPHGRDYPDLVAAVARMNAGKVAALARADHFGVRDKAAPLLDLGLGGVIYPYGPFRGPSGLNEGGTFYAQGLKGEIKIVKVHGAFLLDASAALDGVDADYLKGEETKLTKTGAAWAKAASSATSGDDLLAKLTTIQKAD